MASLRNNLWWLLAILPFALLFYIVAKFGVPVPFLDEWDLVPLLQKMYAGNLAVGDLWTLHNEHRLLFPQAIMLGLAWLTNWNIRYEMWMSVVLAAGIFALLTLQMLITARKLAAPQLRWAIPFFSLIVFSISQYQNWLWGWQLQILLSVFAVTAGIVLLANPPFNWIRFAGAAVCGVVASYSFGNGGVFWLTGLLILSLVLEPGKERTIRLALWIILTGLTMGMYFYHYERLEAHPPLTLLFSQPLTYLAYIFKYVGNICAQYASRDASIDGGFAFFYGLMGLAILVWAILAFRRTKLVSWRTLAPALGLCCFSIASAMVVGIGRLGMGTDQAASSRYCAVTVPFWASLVMMLMILQLETKGKSKLRLTGQRTAAQWFLGIITIMLVFGSLMAINGAVRMSTGQEVGRKTLLTIPVPVAKGLNYSGIGAIHPNTQLVLDRFPFLKEHRLTVFQEELSTGENTNIEARTPKQ